jgi:hypothetical protein
MKAKILGAAALCAGILGLAGDVSAGQKNTTSVVVISNLNMSGSLGLARNTNNNVEYIGCWNNGNGVASCSAKTAAGTFASCSTSTAGHLLAIRSMSGDSYININYNAAGACTSLSVWNYSDYATKNH